MATYQVKAQYDTRAGGELFGSFSKRDEAEECLIVLAGRLDVVSAQIMEVDD